MATKIKYEQKYLDDELRRHITELLEKLVEVPTDNEEDEEVDKENRIDEENEDDYETDSEDENNNSEDVKDQNLALKKATNGNHDLKTKIKDKTQTEEAMELT